MPFATEPAPARVLLAILVYNGRDFVGRGLESAAAISGDPHALDVLVLDDCSPEPGFSAEVEEQARGLGFIYYRSPRNLGIPRNMNLALLKGMADDYDYVILANSDVVFPQNLVSSLVAAAATEPQAGSVTAWSNSVSIFSVPNDGLDPRLADAQHVDWISSVLEKQYAPSSLSIPTGVGFCLLMPVAVVRDVGLLDPIFGRGYCEEVDWCLRSHQLGYRSVLAPGTFVFHEGSATTREVGLLTAGVTTIWEHEAIVDLRHPNYRAELSAFVGAGGVERSQRAAANDIVLAAAATFGYEVTATWIRTVAPDATRVVFRASPGGGFVLDGQYLGFHAEVPLAPNQNVIDQLAALIGRKPEHVGVFDRGALADRLIADGRVASITVKELRSYPERL